MDFAHRMDTALCCAAFVLPAWLVFRLPRYSLSLPVGALVFWGLLANNGFLLLHVDPEYESIAPVMFLLVGGPLGFIYCLFWAGFRKLTSLSDGGIPRKSRSAPVERVHVVVGLVVWWSLWAFCVVLPFVHRPANRRSDPTFFEDYFGVCSPIFLIVIAMSLMYLVQLLRRGSVSPENPACNPCNGEPGKNDWEHSAAVGICAGAGARVLWACDCLRSSRKELWL